MLWIARVACFVATLIPVVVKAHSRFEYPEAQQPLTNIKDGPCGDKTNNFEGIPMEITAGPMTVEIKESIQHKGAPFVIMLSGDGTDDEACMLLDHIPHNADAAKPLYKYVCYSHVHLHWQCMDWCTGGWTDGLGPQCELERSVYNCITASCCVDDN